MGRGREGQFLNKLLIELFNESIFIDNNHACFKFMSFILDLFPTFYKAFPYLFSNHPKNY